MAELRGVSPQVVSSALMLSAFLGKVFLAFVKLFVLLQTIHSCCANANGLREVCRQL